MRVIKIRYLSAILALLVMAFGCGSGDKDETSDTGGDAVSPDSMLADEKSDDWKAITAVIEETITRLKYGDKTGLYENEFQYLRDDETFEEYLKHGEVSWANADSLDHVEVIDMTIFGQDSAIVEVRFHFVSPGSGEERFSPGELRAYYHQGHWIKPYMSTVERQLEYEELMRQADEDADDG